MACARERKNHVDHGQARSEDEDRSRLMRHPGNVSGPGIADIVRGGKHSLVCDPRRMRRRISHGEHDTVSLDLLSERQADAKTPACTRADRYRLVGNDIESPRRASPLYSIA